MATEGKPIQRRIVTGSWREPFLVALSKCGNVWAACQIAKVSRVAAYKERKLNKEFAKEWDDAKDDAVEILENEARRRAMKSSDVLLMFLLKCNKPEFYNRDRLQVQHSGSINMGMDIVVDFTGGKTCESLDQPQQPNVSSEDDG